MNNKVIIIGGVAGGASCAARLRRHNEQFEIILLERGASVSFANCGLPYYIGNIIQNEDSLYLASTATFRDRFQIDARTHSEVIQIDRRQKKISILNRLTGNTYDENYDFLVLAPGSKPIHPNLPGIDHPGIFSLSDIPDSQKIKHWIHEHKARCSVVVGGGYIGLEVTENLVQLGIDTTIIERTEQLMPSVDPEMTAELENTLVKNGVKLLFGAAVSSFEQNNKQLTVNTTQGQSITADLVILATGIRPESDLARQCALRLGNQGHILVDANLRTSDPFIYAVGDCIEVHHTVSGRNTTLPLAGPANRQGRIVADVLAGRGRHFRGVQGTAVCGLFDITIASTGLNEKTLRSTKHTNYGVIYAHPRHHVDYYPGASCISLKLLFDKASGKILGAQGIGEKGTARRIDVIAMAMQMGATVFDLEESELCYAPQYGAAKDPVNLLGMIASNAMRGDLDIAHWDDLGGNGILLLDVRNPDEVHARPLPDAVNIPLNDLRQRWYELRQLARENPSHQATFVTCATGARANTAVRLLRNLGHPAFLLPGGEKTWAAITKAQRNNPGKPVHPTLCTTKPDIELPVTPPQNQNYVAAIDEEVQVASLHDSPTPQDTAVDIAVDTVVNTEAEPVERQTTTDQDKPAPPQAAQQPPHQHEAETGDIAVNEDITVNAETLANALGTLKILRAIPTNNAAAALQRMEQVSVNNGDVITRSGEKNTHFYILFRGSAEKRQIGIYEGDSPTLSLLYEGEHFNEETLITDGFCEADVTMLTDGLLLYMQRSDFLELIAAPLLNVVDVQELLEISSKAYRVIDVRYPEEIGSTLIPGAINIPLTELRGKLNKLMLSQNYVVCCNDGKRSAIATMILRQHSYRATFLRNGIDSWPFSLESLTQRPDIIAEQHPG